MPSKLPIALLLLAILAACTEKPSLTLSDKAKFTVELIESRPECATYVQRLSPAPDSDAGIRKVYEDAKTAYCIKPDV